MSIPLRLSLLAEKSMVREANGVHTAVVQLTQKLQERDDISLAINLVDSATDVIHAHTVGINYILKSLKYGERLVVSAHVVPDSCLGSLRLERLCRLLAKVYLKFAYNRARLVIAVSPVVKTELEEIGVTTNIVVLCNCVDREEFKSDSKLIDQFREKLGLSGDDFVVLCVGQIVPRKGIDTFIAVAERLPLMKFVWVGSRPFGKMTPNYGAITQLLRNLPENVIFTGLVDQEELPGYYGMSDVFLFPSFQENFSFAILEASSTKLPLILRDNPTYSSYLFAHYLKARNTVEFAEILKNLYEDKGFREEWQQEADILASKYEIGGYMDRLVGCYEYVAGRPFA